MPKILSIKQPYASLIAQGFKDCENRSWKTDYRGTVFIHAGLNIHQRFKKMTTAVIPIPNREATLNLPKEMREAGCIASQNLEIDIHKLPRGKIIGCAWLGDCTQEYRSMWAEEGQWHWVMRTPVFFEDGIPCIGKLSLFEPPDNLMLKLKAIEADYRQTVVKL